MNKILFDKDLTEKISSIFKEKHSRFVVAFWGRGAENRFFSGSLKTVKIICNLATGGTNPHAIEQLMQRGAQVKQHDQLHAKVYIGEKIAVVASANASVNGLGLEGVEQEGWLEAGVVTEPSAATTWFDQLWNDEEIVREITDIDIEEAKELFRNRSAYKPSRRFEDFDVNAENLPLLDWWIDNNRVKDDLNVAAKHLGLTSEEAEANLNNFEQRIADGIEVYEGDINNIHENTWCLQYKLTVNGLANLRKLPLWTCLAGPKFVLRNVRIYQDEEPARTESVMMAVEKLPPHPFEITRKFHRLFCKLINSEEFEGLRRPDEEERQNQALFTDERRRLINEFWRKLHNQYVSVSAG